MEEKKTIKKEKINTISTYCDSKGRTTRRCFHASGEFGVVIIGDYQCQRCEYFRGKDETARTISCSHPDGHPVVVYATDEELRERWRHINLLKIEADTIFDEEDNVDGVKVWSVSQAKEIAKEILSMEKKKMTKAEAFEYLKCKRVSVSDAEMNDRVQSKLFACGVQWKNGGTNVCYYSDYLVITPHGFLCHCDGLGSDYWNRLFHEEISADDILSIEIIEKADGLKYGSSWDEITRLGAQISKILDDMPGHCRVEITECTVNLYDEGVNLYHSDPF